jgi:hypothetical protein
MYFKFALKFSLLIFSYDLLENVKVQLLSPFLNENNHLEEILAQSHLRFKETDLRKLLN